MPRVKAVERVEHVRVRPRAVEQASVVVLEKPFERVRRLGVEAGRRQRPFHQHGCAVANHARHELSRKSRCTELGQESIDCVGKVAAGVDQSAIEIEDDETNHSLPS